MRLDPFAGVSSYPQSFHKFGFTHANPISGTDPSGLFTLGGLLVGFSVAQQIQGIYDGAVLAVGDAISITILGVQAG